VSREVRTKRRIFFAVPCPALLRAIASISRVASARVLYGSLTGNVTDPSGAAVPGAKVEALDVGTGVSRQTIRNSRGSRNACKSLSGFADWTK